MFKTRIVRQIDVCLARSSSGSCGSRSMFRSRIIPYYVEFAIHSERGPVRSMFIPS